MGSYFCASPKGDTTLRVVKLFFIATVYVLPIALLAAAYGLESAYLTVLAFAVQFLGLLAERWYLITSSKEEQ